LSEGALKPLIVPVFIPNQGCPFRCVFCEQERITSQPRGPVDGRQIEAVLHRAIRSKNFDAARNREVAFYGGTFTNLPFSQMCEALEAVAPFIRGGFFHSVRVSTRPDRMDRNRLETMKAYGVGTVELGAQSMEEKVLACSLRGHTAEDTVRAVHSLKSFGFKVGIQLMPGLPGDSEAAFRSTITKVLRLRPHMVRLYPTLVIRGTVLARWYREGKYEPLSLEEALQICVEACIRLEAQGIPVIRIGLLGTGKLLEEGEILSGPWHPAFGFLVRSTAYRKQIEGFLPRAGEFSRITIRLPHRDVPLLRGHRNQGVQWIERFTGATVVRVEPDDSLAPGKVLVEKT